MTALAPEEQFLRTFPPISAETVAEITARGLLSWPGNGLWRWGDGNNGTTRRLDGKQFVRSDNKGDDWHKLIGLRNVVEHDPPFVIFVLEGGKDAVAATELAHRARLLSQVGVVAAQGTGYRPIPSELKQLRGHRVLLIGDRDDAGMAAVGRVSNALTQARVDHAVWNWNAFDSRDGKDLFDYVKAASREGRAVPENLFFFFSPPSNSSTPQPLNSSTLQPFNSSTHKASNNGSTHNGSTHSGSTHSGSTNKGSTNSLESLVERFVVRKRGAGNTLSFALARALKAFEKTNNTLLNESAIDEIFHQWFTRSLPLLPPDADEDRSCAKFYSQLNKVRYLPGSLDAAFDRARTLPLPDIPGLSATGQMVAALMRELQRDAGDESFICPINVVARFAALRFPEQAKRLLLALENAAVARCVERGAPHVPGKPGKSALWRYNSPVESRSVTRNLTK